MPLPLHGGAVIPSRSCISRSAFSRLCPHCIQLDTQHPYCTPPTTIPPPSSTLCMPLPLHGGAAIPSRSCISRSAFSRSCPHCIQLDTQLLPPSIHSLPISIPCMELPLPLHEEAAIPSRSCISRSAFSRFCPHCIQLRYTTPLPPPCLPPAARPVCLCPCKVELPLPPQGGAASAPARWSCLCPCMVYASAPAWGS